MACRSEDISDILTTDERDCISTENTIAKEIQHDPQNSSDFIETSCHAAEACGNEDISDILTTDERAYMSTENTIAKEIQHDPQNSSDFIETSFHAVEACGNEDISDILKTDEAWMCISKKKEVASPCIGILKTNCVVISDQYSWGQSWHYYLNISTDQALRPQSSIIDTMAYKDVMSLLMQLGFKEISEDSRVNRNSLKEKLYGGRNRGPTEEMARHMVDKTMKKHKAVKRQLLDSYFNFINITNIEIFKKELKKPLNKRFPGFIKHMQNTYDTIQKDSSEFQILITGETSAGKSTFLNILLGAKILPSTQLHTTSCVCRLHSSLDKKISYVDNDGNKTLKLTSDDPKEIEEALMNIIGPKTTEDKNTKSLRVVDIYWPIPLLKEDVILVDTPGIGETTLLTKQIVEYLPKADGYIFIIDSSHAGGVQQDRVLHLLQEVRRQQDSEMKDFSNFLFVCNKWDLVKDKDVDSVWENTWKKLKAVCGSLEKWQVIKLCTTLELDLLNLKANHTDEYVDVLTGIENVLMGASYKRIGCHLGWIHKFMMEMDNLIDMQLNGAGSNLLTLQNKARNVMQILDDNTAIIEKESRDALEHVKRKTTYIAEELRKHLINHATVERLEVTLNTLSPSMIRTSIRELTLLHMQIIILEWIQNGPVSKECKTMDEKINKLENQMETTLQTIKWFGFQTRFARNEGGFLSKVKSLDDSGLMKAAIGIAVVFLIGGIFAPFTFGLSFLIPLFLSSALYVYLRSQLIKRMAIAAIERAKSQSSVKSIISHCFEKPYTERIMELKTEFECTISFIRKTILKMEKDVETKKDISSVLYEFRNKIKDHFRRLQTINMLYGERNVVAFKELEIGQILSKTDAFRLYTVKGNFEGKAATLRMMKPHLSVFYVKEIENIRAMDHVNFATHVAIISTLPESMETCHSNDDWLRVLTEPSAGDLETYVLSHRNEIGSVVGESAKLTFIHIAYGISNGLAYIHSKGCVHGQLQLSAVLLCTHMVPKLCDLNVLPYYKDRNHEECIYHTAPEVIKDGTYGPEADVYSYGILLWELWYGRHTKRSEALNELIVCSGGRPELEEKRPPRDLEKLITMCWDGEQNRRPTADVRENILKPNQIV